MVAKNKEDVFVVEKVVKHKISKKVVDKKVHHNIEVMIKWEGYAETHNTWEPLQLIFKDIPKLCIRYFKSIGIDL